MYTQKTQIVPIVPPSESSIHEAIANSSETQRKKKKCERGTESR